MASEEISLRPLSLRPGAGSINPFASFALGAGVGLKNKGANAAARSEEKKKARGDVVKYPRDFLMKFAEMYTRIPTELQFVNLAEIVLDPSDPEREAQRALLQRVAADDADERDWRSRTPLPPAPAAAAAAANQPPREAAPVDPNAPKIQRATDIGRTAWAPVATAPGTAAPAAVGVVSDAAATAETAGQSLRKVKGILNKLTPEKFERLLGQLIPLVASYEVLQGTIHQVFENAVAQPTFVAMYADLCAELDAVLPEFEGPDGPQSFKKMLANTCQVEYEATEVARAEAERATGDQRDDADRKAKQRMLGNVRLIAELFKKGMVNDRIMLLILAEMLGPADAEPSEDNVEAACEFVAVAGASLEGNVRSKARLDAAFTHLAKLANSKSYTPRIRFVIRDVLDLRSQHWVARRETFTAKKLDEIRTEAQAELGIVDVAIPGLEPLISGMEPLPGIAPKRGDDMELFPAFKGADFKSGGAADGENFSAFLGEFVPLPDSNATPPEAPGQAPQAPRAARTDLGSEERESLGKSLFSDFLSSRDISEALAAAQELVVPGFGAILVRLGLEKAFDVLDEAEQVAIGDLIVELASRAAISAEDIKAAVGELAKTLDDLAMDIPLAPKVMGRALGSAVAKGMFGLEVLTEQAGPCENAEARRMFVAAALGAVKGEVTEAGLIEAVKAGGVDVAGLLARDPEFDDHLPEDKVFAEQNGLAALL